MSAGASAAPCPPRSVLSRPRSVAPDDRGAIRRGKGSVSMRQGSCIRGIRGVRWLLPALFMSACGQPGSSISGTVDDGAGLAGELEAYIATYEDGTTAVFYGLRTPSGETIDL